MTQSSLWRYASEKTGAYTSKENVFENFSMNATFNFTLNFKALKSLESVAAFK